MGANYKGHGGRHGQNMTMGQTTDSTRQKLIDMAAGTIRTGCRRRVDGQLLYYFRSRGWCPVTEEEADEIDEIMNSDL